MGKSLASMSIKGRAIEILDTFGRIDFDNLQKEAEEAGSQAVFYGIMAATARRQANLAHLAAKIGEAKLSKSHREGQPDQKKLTEGAIKELVLTDANYEILWKHVYDMEEQADQLEAVKYALVQKQKNIESLAGLVAQEVGARRTGTYAPPPSSRQAVTRPR